MANFPGILKSVLRPGTPSIDVGLITKRERLGIQRGQNVLPYNVNMRGLNRRVDRTKLP